MNRAGILGVQDGTGDVGQPAARPDEARCAVDEARLKAGQSLEP